MAKKVTEAERKLAIRRNMGINGGVKVAAKAAVMAGEDDPRGGKGRGKKAKERKAKGSKKAGKKRPGIFVRNTAL